MTAAMRAHRDRLTLTTLIVFRATVIAMGKHLSGGPPISRQPGALADLESLPRRASTMWRMADARLMPPVAMPTRSSASERISQGG